MVLKIKVKTLDSRNYEFESQDDWTVAQFKEHIQEAVNVTANQQRLIFCGRVLQNGTKLADYDCHEKVVHLVSCPPPSLDGANRDSSSADSNNNEFSPSNDNNRFGDENNVQFSAMTLGADGNLNHILRHIMTLQQAIYSRTLDPVPIGPIEPPVEIDRRLSNAARLLRITVNLIAECMARLPNSSPIAQGQRQQLSSEPSDLNSPSSVINSASSHTDLPREPDTVEFSSEHRPSAPAPETTADDSRIGPSSESSQASRRLSRQSLTTDDLPQASVGLSRPMRPIHAYGSRGQNRSNTASRSHRDEPCLDRFLSILNAANDVQNQLQTLSRRYRELINISRRGGLIVPQSQNNTSEASSQSNAANPDIQTGSSNINPTTAGTQSGQISNTLMSEARVLSQYLPRIMHHSSHLQHALSDFSVDVTRGRLQVLIGHRRISPQSVRRSPPSSSESHGSRANQQNRSREINLLDPTIEGSVTITATTVEAPPNLSESITGSLRPQASATIVVTSEPGQPGLHIPMTIPLTINPRDSTINLDATASSPPTDPRTRAEPHRAASEQEPQPANRSEGSGAQSFQSTQNASARPIGIISGRIPLPFDYHLNCFSPYANYSPSNATHTTPPPPPPATAPPVGARIQVRTARPNVASTQTSSSTTQNSNPANNTASGPVIDAGLTEVVSNILGSLFRPPTEGQQPPPQSSGNQGPRTTPSDDQFLNMIPELAINAANQILGGVFGMGTNQRPAQDRSQPNQPPTTSSASVFMDIDIDDSSSSQSDSRYQDARESSSPSVAATSSVPLTRPSSTRHNESTRLGQSGSGSSDLRSDSRIKYSREQLAEVIQNHPEWIPIIQTDIDTMERGNATNSVPHFSDAYLSSIPRKRRRLLAATPDRVLILQPSPSRAISNLLRRAISNSEQTDIESLDHILGSLSDDSDVQAAYEEHIKSAVEARLKSDSDYCPEKFENSSKYFK